MTRAPLALALVLSVAGCAGDTKLDSDEPTDDSALTDDTGEVVDADGDGSPASEDCDDDDDAVNPEAAEVCDGVDNDCDGQVDDDDDSVDASTGVQSWGDGDSDGFGDPEASMWSCAAPEGSAANSEDCDDDDDAVNPEAAEICDGADNDCDGLVDDADESLDASTGVQSWSDADGDGYGDAGSSTWSCAAPSGSVLDDSDCDDADGATYPGAAEVCDGLDNSCEGDVDEGLLGAGEACAADSCLSILSDDSSAADGAYFIDHDGDSSTTAIELQCNMTAGGWTLGLVINSIKVESHADFGASEVALEALALSPADTSSTSYADTAQGWLDLNNAAYTELVLAAYADGAETYMSDPIDRAELRINFGDDGYFLYNDSNGYYWCGGEAAYTDGGVGQVNQPSGAPADCKGHNSLGSGWDFSTVDTYNNGLTNCGVDYSIWMYGGYGTTRTFYPNPGAAQAIWVR